MLRVSKIWLATAAILMTAALVGCEEQRKEKEVFKVTGKVLVDGMPAEGVLLGIHNSEPYDKQFPTAPQGQTDAQGNLIISTYEQGDGLPPGNYTFTFTWQDFNLMSRSYSGPDKLKKRYSDAKSSKITSVVKGPVDLGEIKLTTK